MIPPFPLPPPKKKEKKKKRKEKRKKERLRKKRHDDILHLQAEEFQIQSITPLDLLGVEWLGWGWGRGERVS